MQTSLPSLQRRENRPRLRVDLEPVLVHDKLGRAFYRLSDPLKLSEKELLLPIKFFFLLDFFDGRHTVEDISAMFRQKFREELPPTHVAKLIKSVDHAFLLNNERFERRLNVVLSRYRRATVRNPVFIECFAAHTEALREQIDGYLAVSSFTQTAEAAMSGQVTALVSPHIDPRLGGPTYASIYKSIALMPPETVFVILGISHHTMRNSFALTDKAFLLPGGTVRTDQSLCHRVAALCQTDFYQDELHHRHEHSIEFQTVFLHHFSRTPFTILPILCSFSYDMSEREERLFDEFADALSTAIAEERRNVVLIAGVDLSHIGPRYGDAAAPDPFRLAEVETFDKSVLDAVMRRDLESFDRLFINSSNRYNVCGYPALRTLMRLLPPSQATLISYDNAIMDAERSTVTFASVIFYND